MKEFNITGVCIPSLHYMVDITDKLTKIQKLIEKGLYFTINRARQYGKTTTLSELEKVLVAKGYTVIFISFEGMGEKAFSNENEFCESFINIVSKILKIEKTDVNIIAQWEKDKRNLEKLDNLSEKITQLIQNISNEVILMIDEVDKSSNNQLFLNFLGMLRQKYLMRSMGKDTTFKSVILTGVYDIKNLKLKLLPGEEKKYNSPWNIAADFDIDLSFSAHEIASMLEVYEKDNQTGMDITEISSELYQFTNGYPFLVSKLCKLIDEKLERNWTSNGVNDAVKLLLDEKNTLFDDLIKNLENYEDIYNSIYSIAIEGKTIIYNADAYEKEIMFGILTHNNNNRMMIHNKIFEIRIYNYMIAKRARENGELLTYEYRSHFIVNGKLDMSIVLTKFQEVMHDEFREKDAKFIEREGRLLFLCFLKPIINGQGFYYVEPETRMDNRMDIVVTYGEEQHIVELKIWHGENYEQEALEQLSGYLESKRENRGYLVSFSFNKNKKYSREWKKHADKDIFAIVV